MRPLEALFTAAVILVLFLRWMQPRNRQVTATVLAMIGILAALHLVFDGWRWEMIPAYLMGAFAIWTLAADLRRVSGAKAGESSRWIAIPSTQKRVATGAALALGTILAIVIPAWAFPRIVLPEPDGLYYVGRMDVSIADASRNNRQVGFTVWYPAEQPNGKELTYHPRPGELGSMLRNGSSLPAFAFRNLTATRTYSTTAARFSIREGRSPIVLMFSDTGSTRYDGTALYERLASNGYVIASLDDESAPYASNLETGITERAADLKFVLDKLVSLPANGPLDTLNTHVRIDRIAVMGRGVGAAAAMELGASDPRVTAVAAITPGQFSDQARRGVRRPFFAFTVSDLQGLDDAMKFGGTEARLEATTPAALSDRALLGKPVVGMLGIESGDSPRDVHAAVSALTLRFLDQYLKERRETTQVDLPSRVHVHIIPHQPRAG